MSVELEATLQEKATVEADLTGASTLDANISEQGHLNGDLIVPSYIYSDSDIYYNTTEFWNSKPEIIAHEQTIYVYTDHDVAPSGQFIAGFKVGDGTSYLIDLPFTDINYINHINNSSIHITQQEREFWNNKNRGYLGANETLVLTTN